MEGMRDGLMAVAMLVVLAVNLGGLISLAAGLARPNTARLRQMLRVAWICTGVAIAAWLLLPALHAADLRSLISGWSAGERQLVQQNRPDMNLSPVYEASVLFDTLYVFPLPLLSALILRYRWVRVSRGAPITVP